MDAPADDDHAVTVFEGPHLPHPVLAKKLKHYNPPVKLTAEYAESAELIQKLFTTRCRPCLSMLTLKFMSRPTLNPVSLR